MSTAREKILQRVNAALAPLKERAPLPEWERDLTILRQARGEVNTTELFVQRMKGTSGKVVTTAEELIELLQQGGWVRGYCDPEVWPLLAPVMPSGFHVETTFDRARVDEYQFGITRAAAGVAETGTLVLTDESTTRRLAALAPWVHIALLSRRAIHQDLPQAVASLGSDRNIIWCTGPSKTADVEGILIEGVHGPGVQVAWVVE